MRHDHLLQTPDTFVRIPLPGAQGVEFVVHASPRLGAGFTQMTAEFVSDGMISSSPAQRFLYVLEGELEVTADGEGHHLSKDGYAFVPERTQHTVTGRAGTRAVMIEKPYVPGPSTLEPKLVVGCEAHVESVPLMGDPALRICSLMPDDSAYDFAVNTMTYDPGAGLSMVEVHVMEHGLLMLDGGGIYRLGDSWYPVEAGDFIWMAPYCPQWFGAIGKKPAKYLIYKDWRRHPLGA